VVLIDGHLRLGKPAARPVDCALNSFAAWVGLRDTRRVDGRSERRGPRARINSKLDRAAKKESPGGRRAEAACVHPRAAGRLHPRFDDAPRRGPRPAAERRQRSPADAGGAGATGRRELTVERFAARYQRRGGGGKAGVANASGASPSRSTEAARPRPGPYGPRDEPVEDRKEPRLRRSMLPSGNSPELRTDCSRQCS
jgi:hypothetical protein